MTAIRNRTADRLHDIDSAAAYLRCGRRLIYRLVAERRLTHTKAGRSLRFWQSDLDAYLDAGTVHSTGPSHTAVWRPAEVASRASFGAMDKMASGKWRARRTGPNGKRQSATFPTKADARVWLATQQTDAVRRMWRAPEGARRTVDEFAADYLKRQDLRDSTRVLYANLWRLHLADRWTGVEVGDVTPAMVRS